MLPGLSGPRILQPMTAGETLPLARAGSPSRAFGLGSLFSIEFLFYEMAALTAKIPRYGFPIIPVRSTKLFFNVLISLTVTALFSVPSLSATLNPSSAH